MLQAAAILLLVGAMAAFAVFAALLNERDPARRRRTLGHEAAPTDPTAPAADEGMEVGGAATGDRRLPVGDFLFGALFLRGPEPLAFSTLADAADRSGMSLAQVLAWIERAEAGGLIERVTDAEDGEPAVRLTEAGIYIACNDRRRHKRARKPDRSPAARALDR